MDRLYSSISSNEEGGRPAVEICDFGKLFVELVRGPREQHLITMNLLMTASIVGVLSFSANKPILLQWVVGATAYSVVVGVIFFMGGAALLPTLGG